MKRRFQKRCKSIFILKKFSDFETFTLNKRPKTTKTQRIEYIDKKKDNPQKMLKMHRKD